MALSLTSFVIASILLSVATPGFSQSGSLSPFYEHACPKALEIVESLVTKAVAKEARMAASLLRLHFHDCSAQGCDGSLLLDNSTGIVSEKGSNPNLNSARGFKIIDSIKSALEKECPQTISCADILAIVARDSIVLAGGPSYEVLLGRRNSRNASLSASNNGIPAPNSTFQSILSKYQQQGLDLVDLVALTGSHTIGNSRCANFRQRLYNQSGNGQPDSTLDESYAVQLRSKCPKSGGDNNLFFLDFVTPNKFDNIYFKHLMVNKGLLNTDQVLYSKNKASMALVEQYAENNELYLQQFAKSMIKLGNTSPLTGSKGEIRKKCRKIN